MLNKINRLTEELSHLQDLLKSFDLSDITKEESELYEALKSEFEGKSRELHKLELDYKLTNDNANVDVEIREKANLRKHSNLKLVSYYKYFNPVKEIKGQKTKNDKDKKVYKRVEPKGNTPLTKISGEKIARAEMCSSYFTALTNITFTKSKIVKANRCKDKFCAICQKVQSIKNELSLQVIYDYVKDVTDYQFIFVTFTAPNIKAEELIKELDDYKLALDRFFKNKRIKKINKGYVAKLEITYSLERDDYHPHFHTIMAVPKNYFENPSIYIKHSDMLEIWKKAKQDNTITQLNVKKVKNKNVSGISSEILELSKYLVKSEDYLSSLEIFETLYNSTYRRRAFRFGGIFRDGYKKFKNGELEKYKKLDNVRYEYLLKYNYRFDDKKYERIDLRKLTEEEITAIAMNELKNLQDEFE